MIKPVFALALVLISFSACTKTDKAEANGAVAIAETRDMSSGNPFRPPIDGERPEVTDPQALALMKLFNSQTPAARLPETNDSTLVFTAPNGDEFHLRRTAINVVVQAGPFLAAGANPEKFALDNGIMYNTTMPTIFFTRTPMRTMEMSFLPVEAVVNTFVRDAPEFISNNGNSFTLGNDLVRLTWDASTLVWSLGVQAQTLIDTGLDVSLLKGYALKDGFLMNTMQPIA